MKIHYHGILQVLKRLLPVCMPIYPEHLLRRILFVSPVTVVTLRPVVFDVSIVGLLVAQDWGL